MRKLITLLALGSLSLSCRFLVPAPPENTSPEPETAQSPASGRQTPTPTPVSDNEPCFTGSSPDATPAITLEGIYKEYNGSPNASSGITAYLNARGEINRLQTQLTETQTDSGEKIKTQVIDQDVTGDSIPDVIVSLALPSVPGYGDTILAVYACEGGQYWRHGIFGRTGAGGRGEGLYNSGGARIEDIQDLNSDDVREIVFFVPSLGELYIAGWDGADFASLVQNVDELGNQQNYIPAQEGFFEIRDVNNDGNLEIVVTDPAASEVWAWDGATFQPLGE